MISLECWCLHGIVRGSSQSDPLACVGPARDLLAGMSLWSNLTSIMVGLAGMTSFRLLGVHLLKSLPGG